MDKNIFTKLFAFIFLTFFTTNAFSAQFNLYVYCYTWPDGSKHCGKYFGSVDPCSLCPCYAPDEEGNSVQLTCQSKQLTNHLDFQSVTDGVAVQYNSKLYHLTDDYKIVVDCSISTEQELVDFSGYIDTFDSTAYLKIDFYLDGSNNLVLDINEIDDPLHDSILPGTNFHYVASSLELDSYCSSMSLSSEELDALILQSGKDQFTIYPVPASNNITIDWPESQDVFLKGVQFKLYSIDGKVVLNKTLNTRSTVVNVSTLPRGLYIYKITIGDQNNTVYSEGKLSLE